MIKKAITKYKKLPVQMKASMWFLVCGFLQKGISMITTPIFTRLMTTSEYGRYNTFNSWLNILTAFVSLRLYGGMYARGLVKYSDNRDEYSSSLQGLSITVVLGWTIIYFAFSDFWNALFSLTTYQMIAMLSMIWTTAAFSFWSLSERVDFRYRTLVIITLAVSLAKPLVGIVLVLNADDKVTARIIVLAIVELIAYIPLFLLQMKRGGKFFDRFYWKEALALNIPLIPHYLSMNILNGADKIMITNMVGSSEAGIYSLAYSISLIMTIFNSALLQTLEPWLYKKISKREIRSISKVAYPAFIFIMAVNMLLMLFAPEVIAIFAPAEYYDAIWIIPPVITSVFFLFTYTFFAVFEFYYKKTKQIAIATTFGAVLNIVLNYIFIRMFGYYAAGYTTLVCYIAYSVCHAIFMNRICNQELNGAKPYKTKTLMLLSAGYIGLSFLIMCTYLNTIVRYGIIIIVVVVILVQRKTIKNTAKNFISLRNKK